MNILRSIPFLILLILVIPLTKLIVGQSYGSSATIVPLVIAAAPFIARMVESSLKEVEPGVIEAAVSMGAGTGTIIWKVLLAEARTSLLVGVTIAVGTILGYSAMAGTVGGGGIGTVSGTIAGAFIIGFLENVMNLLGVNSYIQQIIEGAIIVLAVAFDVVSKSKKSRKVIIVKEEGNKRA